MGPLCARADFVRFTRGFHEEPEFPYTAQDLAAGLLLLHENPSLIDSLIYLDNKLVVEPGEEDWNSITRQKLRTLEDE
jgi:hypothetical protein